MSTPAAFSVCVYCGSRTGTDPAAAQAAREVGQWIGAHGGQLVYGGGHNGLMGILADSASAAGARVVGVIPHSMVEREWARTRCEELIVVDTMHERKRIMMERGDAFLALPGGIGTFEEFFEAWAWRQLGFHDKPVGLLNTRGYYDPMLAFMHQATEAGFVSDWQMGLIRVGSEPAALLAELVQAAGLGRAPGANQI
ncbi:MAG: family protein in fasciation locus [Pseudomonadota bacterium]|jgi:uncharacterized protein (TIGR00730 family)